MKITEFLLESLPDIATLYREAIQRLQELEEHVSLCHDALGESRGSDTSELYKYFENHHNLIKRHNYQRDRVKLLECTLKDVLTDWSEGYSITETSTYKEAKELLNEH